MKLTLLQKEEMENIHDCLGDIDNDIDELKHAVSWLLNKQHETDKLLKQLDKLLPDIDNNPDINNDSIHPIGWLLNKKGETDDPDITNDPDINNDSVYPFVYCYNNTLNLISFERRI